MNRKNASQIRIVTISIEPYLAEYAQMKFADGGRNGAIRIPYNSEFYHCVWEHMAKRRVNQVVRTDGNLGILLPSRRLAEDGPVKNPAYYNYLSPVAVQMIERYLRRQFNYEFHQLMLDNENNGRPVRQQDLVADFIRRYRLESISEDALLKSFQRYRQRLHPRKPRKYEKRRKIKKN